MPFVSDANPMAWTTQWFLCEALKSHSSTINCLQTVSFIQVCGSINFDLISPQINGSAYFYGDFTGLLEGNSTRIFFLPTFTVTLDFWLIKRKYGCLDFQRHLLGGRCSNVDFYGIQKSNFSKILPWLLP